MKNIIKLKAGLFGIGLETYWNQFDGLKNKLEEYLAIVEKKISNYQIDLINMGLIDNIDKAFNAGYKFRSEDVDIIFLYVTTYALSATVLPIVQRAKVPVIILNLSPEPSINYDQFNALTNRREMTGMWLRYCSSCPVPEISNTFKRGGIPFFEVTGLLENDEATWIEISEWIEAAQVVKIMNNNRMGVMGTYYSGMLDIYTDLTKQLLVFGGHIEILEVDELTFLTKNVNQTEIDSRANYFYNFFNVRPDCSHSEIQRAARTSIALDRLVKKYQLGSMAYYYKGYNGNDNEMTMSSIILGNTLLTAKGIPVAGEYEIKNVQAMKIMDSFGAGGSFTEYYAMDYNEDVVLMGHDGPAHTHIGEGKTKVRPLDVYHGKVSKGLTVEMQVKHGPITCLSLVERFDGTLFFLVAEGESVAGPILKIGNTNSRYKFPIDARTFVNQWNSHGPAHHCAIGIGHIAHKIDKLGKLLGIDIVKVC